MTVFRESVIPLSHPFSLVLSIVSVAWLDKSDTPLCAQWLWRSADASHIAPLLSPPLNDWNSIFPDCTLGLITAASQLAWLTNVILSVLFLSFQNLLILTNQAYIWSLKISNAVDFGESRTSDLLKFSAPYWCCLVITAFYVIDDVSGFDYEDVSCAHFLFHDPFRFDILYRTYSITYEEAQRWHIFCSAALLPLTESPYAFFPLTFRRLQNISSKFYDVFTFSLSR